MSAEGPDDTPTNGDGNAERVPAVSFWRTFPIFLTGCVPLVLMDWGLDFAFDLPGNASLVLPALLVLLVTAAVARPTTFRHGTVVALVGVALGALAMLCYLPVTIFAQSYEFWTGRLVFRLPAAASLAILSVWIAPLVCRRLGVPLLENPAKCPSDPNAP